MLAAREILLANGRGVALVSPEDFGRIAAFAWRLSRWGYAVGWTRGGSRERHPQSMHRLVINAPDGVPVDHISGVRLDNTRGNLRLASASANAWNYTKRRGAAHSRFKGVTWHTRCQRWQVQIRHLGVSYYLGLFDNEIEAALVYDEAARMRFGEFARPNFPAGCAA